MTIPHPELRIDPKLAQMMYTRVLRSWASDVLNLRRQGLDKPSHRKGLWTRELNPAEGPWPFAQTAERRSKAA